MKTVPVIRCLNRTAVITVWILLFPLTADRGEVPHPANSPMRIIIPFSFNSVLPQEEVNEHYLEFLNRARKRGNRYLLLQGFACDLGGFDRALMIARRRMVILENKAHRVRPGYFMIGRSEGSVIFFRPREDHRRVIVRAYRRKGEMLRDLRRARELAENLNRPENRERQRILLQQGGIHPTVEKGAVKQKSDLILWLVVSLVLSVLLFVIILQRSTARRSKLRTHTLTRDEAESLTALTMGEVEPVILAEEEKSVREESVRKKGVGTQARSVLRSAFQKPGSGLTMATRKKTTAKTKPISIRGAVDREFENTTLSKLAKSPINALEGLTPRHARLLEEGFGVKTIEDLAKLKYFEIARAIVVLARYEK